MRRVVEIHLLLDHVLLRVVKLIAGAFLALYLFEIAFAQESEKEGSQKEACTFSL